MKRHILTLFAMAIALTFSASASAQDMAGLEVDIGSSVDANVRSDVEEAIESGVESTGRFEYIPAPKARSQINPVARDCYTGDCLKKAGDNTGAEAGIRVRFSGEAQIYDWTVETYDLRNGKLLVSDKGACELCGRAEVKRTFQKSVSSTVGKTRVSTPKPKAVATKPKPESEPTADEPDDDTAGKPSKPTTTVSGADEGRTGARVEVSVQPPDTEIFLEGESLGTGDRSIELEPGSYQLRFAREGYQGFKESIMVQDQQAETLTMRVHLSKTDPDPVVVESGGGLVDELQPSDRVVYGTISAATGAVILGIGLWLATLDGEPACGDGAYRECPDLWDTDGIAITSAVVGTGLIIGGISLLAWDFLAGGPEAVEEEKNEEGVSVTPSVGADSVGLQVLGRF